VIEGHGGTLGASHSRVHGSSRGHAPFWPHMYFHPTLRSPPNPIVLIIITDRVARAVPKLTRPRRKMGVGQTHHQAHHQSTREARPRGQSHACGESESEARSVKQRQPRIQIEAGALKAQPSGPRGHVTGAETPTRSASAEARSRQSMPDGISMHAAEAHRTKGVRPWACGHGRARAGSKVPASEGIAMRDLRASCEYKLLLLMNTAPAQLKRADRGSALITTVGVCKPTRSLSSLAGCPYLIARCTASGALCALRTASPLPTYRPGSRLTH